MTTLSSTCSTQGEVRLDGMKILDVLFYGYVEGHFDEWGTFSLKELSELPRGPFGLRLSRIFIGKRRLVVTNHGLEGLHYEQTKTCVMDTS